MDYTYLEARGRVGTASVCHRCGPNLHAFNGGGNWSTQINPPRQGKACQHCGSNPRPSNHHVVMKLQSTEVYLLSILHGKLGKTNRQTHKEKLVAVYIISQIFKRKKDWLQRDRYVPIWHAGVSFLFCCFFLVHWKSIKINTFCFYSVKILACGEFCANATKTLFPEQKYQTFREAKKAKKNKNKTKNRCEGHRKTMFEIWIYSFSILCLYWGYLVECFVRAVFCTAPDNWTLTVQMGCCVDWFLGFLLNLANFCQRDNSVPF